jgi:hypothetical protein
MSFYRISPCALTFVVALLVGCHAPQATDDPDAHATEDIPDRLPDRWDESQTATASLSWDDEWKRGCRPQLVRVLAWKAQENAQERYCEECIVWIQCTWRGASTWRVAHLFRESAVIDAWELYETDHLPNCRDFDHPPTTAEVNQFVKRTAWKFQPWEGYDLRAGVVCVRNWREVIGQEPDQFFDSKLIKPDRERPAIAPPPREAGTKKS